VSRRIDALRRRIPPAAPCPEHLERARDWRADYREGLALFSPDDDERHAVQARQEAEADRPPCTRCGWKPDVVLVRADPAWGGGPWPVSTDE
jgi:hypothetical protein